MNELAPALSAPIADETRRFRRVRVDLLGRFMLSDRREFPCQVADMSPGGAGIIAPIIGKLGEQVIAYLDHVGRIEGMVIRHIPNGFGMTIEASPRKRDKLADQLTWLTNRHLLGSADDRVHPRIVPRNAFVTVTLPDGEKVPGRMLDMSMTGTAISGVPGLKVGDVVQISRTMGRVVRLVERGFAVEFSLQQPRDTIVALAREVGVDLPPA